MLFKITELGEFTSFEYPAIELKIQSILFVITYQPPKHSLLSLYVTSYDKVVLNGDLNTYVNKKDRPKNYGAFKFLGSFDKGFNTLAQKHIRYGNYNWTKNK